MQTTKPLQIISVGLAAGLIYEFSAVLYRCGMHKNIFGFIKSYPGLSFTFLTAGIGSVWTYKVMLGELFRNFMG